MLTWFADNAGTIAVTAALCGAVALIVVRLRKDKRQGKHICGGNCGSCPMSGSCHKS